MTNSLLKAKKGDILKCRGDNNSTYRAVCVGYDVRGTNQRIFYNIIPLGKTTVPRRSTIGAGKILEATDEYPEFKIGETVRLSDRSGEIIGRENGYFYVGVYTRSQNGRTRTGRVKIAAWDLLVHNPEKLETD